MMPAVDALRPEDEIRQRQGVNRLDLGNCPVVSLVWSVDVHGSAIFSDSSVAVQAREGRG
jgi:hypothetical protein